jgi:mycobactin peptide synthetase MbtE
VTDTSDTQIEQRRLELLRRRLAEKGLSRDTAPAEGATGELSDGQRRMWFVQSMDATGALLNICVSYRITGTVDITRLHRAVDAVAVRHPLLRTTFHSDDDGAAQRVTHDEMRPGFDEHDLSGLSDQARRLRLEVLAQREFARPFDLATDSPLRITVARIAADELVLLLTAHHIAWDDASWTVFFTDLTRAYIDPDALGGPRPAAGGPAQAAGRDDDLAYWRAVLGNPPEPLELPGPNGSAVPDTWRAQRTTIRLPRATVDRVAALARDTGASPYMVLLAAFATLIHRYTHADDFLIAAPVSNRDAGAEGHIGYYGNTVALRLRPHSQQTFGELLADVRDSAVGAFAHQRVNLDRVVRELNPDRRHGVERMTRISFGLREPDNDGFHPPGVHCRRDELRGRFTQLPLGFMAEIDDRGAVLEAEYLIEVLDKPLVDQLLRHYAVLLDEALAAPATALCRLGLLDADDAEWLRRVSTGPAFTTPATTLAALVQGQTETTPDAVAVVYEGRAYSYREINAEANRVAHWLMSQDVGAEDRVAVLLDRSPELVITALGILKAGAAYLPVDPTYPADRRRFILDDSAPTLVLRQPVCGLENYPTADPGPGELIRPVRPENTAYVIYTSGSTGLPKGVPVSHTPIAEYFVWFGGEYRVDAADRLLQVASPSFDVSMGEIFGTLACGARLVIPRPDGLRDIGYLTNLLDREGITAMHFVPSLLGLFLSLPGVNAWRTLRRVPIGGEALPGETADKFHATFDALLHNFYGPTETVVNATRFKVEGPQGTRTVPIGKPKINTTVHLLDDALAPVPVGVIGEIYIGGTHVARGYHRRPDLTAERFIADPFSTGGRLYRTGDLARRNTDGDVEFVGRADEQVKIRGFRIELGEVAAAISVDPSVGQAVVVTAELGELGTGLIGYLTPADGADDVDVDRIRARVAAALPDYMVPAAYVVVGEIPITAHGKIDRAALPAPQIAAGAAYRRPATATEGRLAGLFADLLGRRRVGADDSFFELGGHSMLATKLVAAVRTECAVELPIRDVFELATVVRLADRIDALATGTAAVPRPKLTATTHDAPLPLSASQLRMWFAYRIEGPSPVNNIPFAARLTGPCDGDALAAAVRDVVARHEILRTTYREIDGLAYQVVHPAGDVAVRHLHGDGQHWLQQQLDAERRCCLDLERDWPIRAAVLQAGDTQVVSLVVHHIAADHASAGVLFSDLLTAYRARRDDAEPTWAPLPVQYADYAAWQQALLAEPDGGSLAAGQRDYWTRQLAGLPQDTGLRPDFPRPAVPSGQGASVEFSIDAAARDNLAALGRELGATEFMLLQAAVAVVLHKAGGGADIPLGTPIAGRPEAELDDLIGFFVNIVVLRNDLHGNPTLREVLARARETALAAYAHSDLPFDRVVDAVSPVRSLSRNPLFQVVVHVRDELPTEQPAGDTVFAPVEPPFDVAHADLSVNFFAADTGYAGRIVYRTELYRPATIERLAGWLTRVVGAFAHNADTTLRDVHLAGNAERRRIVGDWSRGAMRPADSPQTIGELLEPSRVCGADRIAVRCGDEAIDYPGLHRRSDNFAALLAEHGIGPGSLVGLSTRRGIELVVALVGIMKAGAGYFPLDPGYPTVRKQFMLDDVAPAVVVVTAEAAATMPETAGAALISLDDPQVKTVLDGDSGLPRRLPEPHPDDPMYLVFTSGSTGQPKGVLGTQRAMTARLDWQLQHYPVKGNDIRLAQASMTFLEGSMETLAGLAAGATVILADDAEHRDAEALAQLLRRRSVAQVTAVASLVSALVDTAPDGLASLTRLVCSGEPVSSSLLDRLTGGRAAQRGPELLNNFGATETSGGLIRGPLRPPVPMLGKPTPGSQVYLLDEALAPVPVGVVGELYYAGDQLARGYWKRPALTASRFVPNPYAAEPGARFYRSGDRARWTADGRLEFVGRTDHQVKVRGFRVELGEVEAALRGVDAIAAAAAQTWDSGDATTLAGYVAPHIPVADSTERAATAASVRAAVAAVLPGYMTPSSITVLDALPCTESGKLNRPALPRPAAATTGGTEPPSTDTECALAAVFTDLLGIAEIGRCDDFFALGGDSISAVQLAARARAAGLVVSPRMIFEHPTVEQLAVALDAAEPDDTDGGDIEYAPMTTSGLSADELAALQASWPGGDAR